MGRGRERERLGLRIERLRDIGVAIDDDLPSDNDIVLSSATPEWKSPIIQLVSKCFQALSRLGSDLIFNLLRY
jgi:hypothetical protein